MKKRTSKLPHCQKKIEAVQEDLLNLDTKIESVEEKLQEDIDNNAGIIENENSEALKMHKDQSRKLENYWKKILENLIKLRQTC